jgi:hypothetical protein
MTANARTAEAQRKAEAMRAQRAAEAPAKTVSIEVSGKRAAILQAIRKPSETTAQTLLRLVDQADPGDLDIGRPV